MMSFDFLAPPLTCEHREDFHWYHPSPLVPQFIISLLIHVLSLLEASSLRGIFRGICCCSSLYFCNLFLLTAQANMEDNTNKVGGTSLQILVYF